MAAASPGAAPPARAAKANGADSSNGPPGPRYLIIIGSFQLGAGSQVAIDELKSRPLESIRVAPGFPRLATPDEADALRPGYGALLAGICDDEGGAASARRALVAEGVDAYVKQSTRAAASACPRPNERWLLGEELSLAVDSDAPNSAEKVKLLLERGAPASHGQGSATPLNRAAYKNDTTIARLLLERGAAVNVAHREAQEESTLELAIRTPYGDPFEMVSLLIAHGADVNAMTEGAEADPGSTPVRVAIRQCRPRVLELLQEKGAERGPVPKDEVCRDRHPPEAPDTDRIEILRLIDGK